MANSFILHNRLGADGNSISDSQVIEGSAKKVQVVDENVSGILGKVAKELKKLTFHMSLMTDTEISNEEVE